MFSTYSKEPSLPKWRWFSTFEAPVIFQWSQHSRTPTEQSNSTYCLEKKKKKITLLSWERNVIPKPLCCGLLSSRKVTFEDFFPLLLVSTLAGIPNLEYLFLKHDYGYLQPWSTTLFRVKKAEQRSMEAQLMTFYNPAFSLAHSVRKSKLWCFTLMNVFWLSLQLVFKAG